MSLTQTHKSMPEMLRLSQKTLEHYRSALEQKRSVLLALLTLELRPDEVPSTVGDEESFVNVGSSTARAELEMTLWDVERALAAIANDTYGVCSQCGEPIGAIRLNALPETNLCLLCAFP